MSEDLDWLSVAKGYVLAERDCLEKIDRCALLGEVASLVRISINATHNAVDLAKALIAATERITELEDEIRERDEVAMERD